MPILSSLSLSDINVDIALNNKDVNSSTYLTLLASHAMLPAHTIPTHNKTCLDHMILKTQLPAAWCVAETSITDHDAIFLILEQNNKKKCYGKFFSNADREVSLQ